MPEGNGAVRITLVDVWQELQSLRNEVQTLSAVAVTVQDHERRLRSTERVMYAALGLAAATPVAVAIFV